MGALNARKGFAVAEEEIGMSLEEFKALYGRGQAVEFASFFLWRRHDGGLTERLGSRTSLGFFASHADNPSEQIYVYFCDERNVGVKSMRKYGFFPCSICAYSTTIHRLLNILDDKGMQKGIIIYPNTMTPSARKVCIYSRQ
jgi:DNA-directed RNA polymerase I, II, and III subunit RPABC1